MVYQEKLVAVIKFTGKILRELAENTVYLPDLAAYEILIKNLSSTDVILDITIDNINILNNNNTSLVIKSKSNIILDSFLNDKGTKFKFTTGESIIRVEYRFAKPTSNVIYYNAYNYFHPQDCQCQACQRARNYYGRLIYTTEVYDPSSVSSDVTTHIDSSNMDSSHMSSVEASTLNFNPFLPSDDLLSDQEPSRTPLTDLENVSHTIVLTLKRNDEPVLVNSKVKCSNCGRSFKSHIKFCPECGTALFN